MFSKYAWFSVNPSVSVFNKTYLKNHATDSNQTLGIPFNSLNLIKENGLLELNLSNN